MPAFSDDIKNLLAMISVKQVVALVRLLQNNSYSKKEFIERRYQEYSLHFDETLKFLIDVGWITETAENLALTQTFSEDTIVKNLIESLTRQSNPCRTILSDYLAHYVVSGDGIVYRPISKRRSDESAVRNFLIDLDIISYEIDSEWYRLNPAHTGLYLWAKNNQNTASQEVFDASDVKKKALGAAAELVVLEFERSRVSAWQNRIDHVSARQPYACYDIISVTVTEDSVEPRYIEVKAVSESSFRFFWTNSEIEAARLLGDTYYLYLLPVLTKDTFAVDRLLILCNPYKNILGNSLNWIIQNELISCALINNPTL